MSAKEYARQRAAWIKRRERMAALKRAGLSLAEIGRRYRISRQRVSQMLRGTE